MAFSGKNPVRLIILIKDTTIKPILNFHYLEVGGKCEFENTSVTCTYTKCIYSAKLNFAIFSTNDAAMR